MPIRPCAAAVTLALTCLLQTPASADRRSLTYTYQYMTMPKGATELEFYSTQSRGEGNNPPQTFQYQIEIEHGITDRWDVSLYHVFEQASIPGGESEPLHFSEMKLRSRYRLAERGELPVDTLFYGELVKEFAASAYEVEGKVILSRDIGPLTAVANLIGEIKLEKESGEREAVFIPAWAAGLVYEAAPSFTFGAETFGELEPEGDERELVLAAGPAASWAPSESMWIASTLAFGIEHAAEIELRAIIGLHL